MRLQKQANTIVALTGGIGCGKSFVAQRLKQLGIDVYDCDNAAKRLMVTSDSIRKKLQLLVGKDVYVNDKINKPLLTKFLLASDENRLTINNIIHPAVADDFLNSKKQWIESAILFDSGFDKLLPIKAIVCVSAPKDIRVKRIIMRDNINQQQAEEWIARQMSQEEMEKHSDFIIVNDGIADINQQIKSILQKIS